jgi:ribosomal protein S18 acetylase RimI-like enzyme
MSGDIIVRSATEADTKPLCALYCESVRCNRDGFIQDLSFHGCLITKMLLWRDMGGDMLVALDEGAVIGMGALAPDADGRAELCKLHVDASRQGRGIGRLLVERLITLAVERGFPEVKLHVTKTQNAAIGLYRSMGFQPTREEPFQTVVFGEPAIFPTLHMRLPLRVDAITAARRARR